MDQGFETFWRCYPRKASKKDALRAWNKLDPNEDLVQQIIEAVIWQSQSDDWLRDGGRYVPYPATFLRGERWTDEKPETPRVSERTIATARAVQEFLND